MIGCSPAWPNPGRAQSGYLVEGPGRVLLDCGAGVLSRLRLAEAWPQLDAIVLTHLHLDHWADIVPWAIGATYGPPAGAARPLLFVPEVSLDELHGYGVQLGFGSALARAFELRTYDEGAAFAVGGFEIDAIRVPHYTRAAYALRVSGQGRVLTYSGDSAPGPALARAADGADLFLCEATLGDDAYDGDLRGHLSAREAIELAAAADVGRLVLVHRPFELAAPEGIECASDGDTFEL